jgi:hypothetical protein
VRLGSIVVDFVTDKGGTVVDTRVVKVPDVEPVRRPRGPSRAPPAEA